MLLASEYMKLILVAALITFSLPASSDEAINVNTILDPPLNTPDKTGFIDQVFTELFHRIGLPINLRLVPAERAMLNLNQGIDDVTTLRISGLSDIYPNIRQVPEKLMNFEFVAFTTGLNFPISDWRSLAPYNVAIITGWKILEANVTETRSLIKVDNARQLFQLLKKGRVDLVVYEKWEGLYLAKELGMDNIRVLNSLLATREMYPYVNVKKQNLIADITEALKSMKADGTLQKISLKTLIPLTKINQ